MLAVVKFHLRLYFSRQGFSSLHYSVSVAASELRANSECLLLTLSLHNACDFKILIALNWKDFCLRSFLTATALSSQFHYRTADTCHIRVEG